MSMINYASREINCKLVYYGPGLGGKTTNLEFVYNKVAPNSRGKLIPLATETERTLFFDFLPVDPDLSASMFRGESNHQGMREGPGLAAKVANVPERNPHFFHHFPRHGLFERFARLHKTGQDAVHARWCVWRTRQQQLLSPADADDDHGTKPWKEK